MKLDIHKHLDGIPCKLGLQDERIRAIHNFILKTEGLSDNELIEEAEYKLIPTTYEWMAFFYILGLIKVQRGLKKEFKVI